MAAPGFWDLFEEKRARRGRMLIRPQQPAEQLFWLDEGWVRLFFVGRRDKEHTLDIVEPGHPFGELSLKKFRRYVPAYGFFAEALTPVRYRVAPAKPARDALRNDEAAAREVAQKLAARLKKAEVRLKALRYDDVPKRLYALLYALMVEGEMGLEVHLSHGELARVIGSSRETVTRLLGALALEDVLELGYRRVVVQDPERLYRRFSR